MSLILRSLVISLTLLGLMGNVGFAQPQAGNGWTPQMRIPNYKQIKEEPPFLFADQNHTVHAFNSQPAAEEGPDAIWYRRWTPTEGWSNLNDIIVADGAVELLDIFVDNRSVVHLVMQNSSGIYYAWSPLAGADRAPAWSAPIQIGDQVVPPFSATLAGSAQGDKLFVLYGGNVSGKGVYWVSSSDGGLTWSTPEALFLTSEADLVAAGLDGFMAEDGRLHVVWNVYNRRGAGVSGHYAHLNSDIGSWSEPLELDKGDFALGIQFATLFAFHDEILLVYYNGISNQHYWRRSTDGGATWSTPALISPRHVGLNGPVSLAVDSNDTLHLFFAQRIDPDTHGVWHSIWTGAGWTDLPAVVQGPRILDPIGNNAFDPHSPWAVVVNGNLLFVTWATDGGAGSGVWYSYITLGTPELAAIPLPSAAPSTNQLLPTATPPVVTEIATPAARPIANLAASPTTQVDNPALPLLIGLVPAMLLIATAFLYHRRKHRAH